MINIKYFLLILKSISVILFFIIISCGNDQNYSNYNNNSKNSQNYNQSMKKDTIVKDTKSIIIVKQWIKSKDLTLWDWNTHTRIAMKKYLSHLSENQKKILIPIVIKFNKKNGIAMINNVENKVQSQTPYFEEKQENNITIVKVKCKMMDYSEEIFNYHVIFKNNRYKILFFLHNNLSVDILQNKTLEMFNRLESQYGFTQMVELLKNEVE